MGWLTDPQIWISLATLTALEIILGIDNIVVIAILSGRLHEREQGRARVIGLSLALVTRLMLLFALVWLAGLTAPLFSAMGREVSARDLIIDGWRALPYSEVDARGPWRDGGGL